jgi:hypothetical protein
VAAEAVTVVEAVLLQPVQAAGTEQVRVGAVGAVVSGVRVRLVGVLELPAASRATTLSEALPATAVKPRLSV